MYGQVLFCQNPSMGRCVLHWWSLGPLVGVNNIHIASKYFVQDKWFYF